MKEPMTNDQIPMTNEKRKVANSAWSLVLGHCSFLHRDEVGSISIVSVFTLILLTILLGMVINVGRQVDNKIKLQGAADASTYSGGVVLARGMNTLAFSNHMISDVFALTAFMREARDRNAESLVPEILTAWERVGPQFQNAEFPKFFALGHAIPPKIPLERELVRAYSEWAAASSELVLPALEEILAQEMIPEFQRAVVLATPGMAQRGAREIGRRHLPSVSARTPTKDIPPAVFWRTAVDPVAGELETQRGTLPVIDPQFDTSGDQQRHMTTARMQRDTMARRYLSQWNSAMLRPFDHEAKMCQFSTLWRGFTCAQLKQLLDEYPDRNLPHVIRAMPGDVPDGAAYLEEDYMFVGVAYRPRMLPTMPAVFREPVTSDSQAFAQGMLFVPRPRYIWYDSYFYDPTDPRWLRWWRWNRYRSGAHRWDLFCQNWTFQLVPATSPSIGTILQTTPSIPGDPTFSAGDLVLPDLQSVSGSDIRRVTTH